MLFIKLKGARVSYDICKDDYLYPKEQSLGRHVAVVTNYV